MLSEHIQSVVEALALSFTPGDWSAIRKLDEKITFQRKLIFLTKQYFQEVVGLGDGGG